MKQIFLVEDDSSLINGLSFAIKKQGYIIDIARTVLEADKMWEDGKYDLVILDVSLPAGSEFGPDIGGDDYITKPFKLAVFLSRINALLRRSSNFCATNTELNSNGINVQLLKGEVYKNGRQIDLTASEYKLLCLFMENPDIVLSPEQILSRLWDCDENYIDNNTLTVYIRRLRMKIEDNPGQPERIVTIRRMGYKWNTRSAG